MAKKKVVYRPDEEDEFDFLRPDKTMLDTEWVNQPKLFYDYAVQLADARMELDETKAELDVARAEIDKRIRVNPEEYEIEKVTEAVITNTILRQDEYQDKLADVIKAKHQMDVLQAAVNALDHRKAALERLVSLHGQSYFATPRAADETSRETVDEIEKQTARSKTKEKRRCS